MSTEVDHQALRQRWWNFLVSVAVFVLRNSPVSLLATLGQYAVMDINSLQWLLRRGPDHTAGPIYLWLSLQIL